MADQDDDPNEMKLPEMLVIARYISLSLTVATLLIARFGDGDAFASVVKAGGDLMREHIESNATQAEMIEVENVINDASTELRTLGHTDKDIATAAAMLDAIIDGLDPAAPKAKPH